MHYIDLPVSYDASAINKLKRKRMNAVIACQQALIRLHNLQASAVERALALRILLHVVGDLHQPMHAVTCVSKQHPKGDRGGNSVRLSKNGVSRNLHQYWDRGGGLLLGPSSDAHARQIAQGIAARFPCALDKMDIDPQHWALESHRLAVSEIYPKLPLQSKAAVQLSARQRLALAGCRLARILNATDVHISAAYKHATRGTG